MSALFSPFQFRDLAISNRVAVSPMCQYVAIDGKPTSWHLIHLGGLALSGSGMLIMEATAVTPEGRITPGDLGLWDDDTEAALKPVVAAVREHADIALVMQIGHAGRKASSDTPWNGGQMLSEEQGGWQTLAPSALPQKEGEILPQALDAAGLQRLRDAFVDTARRAARLGVDGLELHAAHGYLLHQFLSPIANVRNDEYGGSLENRMRFPLEIFDAVRAVFPAGKPIGVKVSATDWMNDGWDLEQTIAFAQALKERGADWISVSSGGISPLQKITVGPGYQIPFAQAIKQAAGLPVIAVGLITEARQAEEIIASGQADMVALARAMLYDPRWTWHAAAELGASVHAPAPYWRAPPRGKEALFKDTAYGAR
ncbi:NADH:flavin oxidoreductase/NADH oxidase [Undibacterium terreum]|uniref:Oxidoreductase n=1 Tax=Undibacterium terreum TaxID=1224302 RepID=A0A916XJJ1_9BURK|nr:NADH:flavin oxidoreductase/NADH oxidase [Undibacterium terreum]GGC76033.1 oxidoreductase [Undibacterium terreum]